MASNVSIDSGSDKTSNHYCDVCKYQIPSTQAVAYCTSCNKYLCATCKMVHTGLKLYENHTLLTGSNLPSFSTSPIMFCEEHKTMFVNMYCQSHDDVICNTCKSTSHKSCNTTVINQHVQQMKKDGSFEITRELLEELKSKYEKMKVLRNADNGVVEVELDKCLQDVRQIRKNMNEAFDHIALTLLKEKQQVNESTTKGIENDNKFFDDALTQISNHVKSLYECEKARDDDAMYVGMKKASNIRRRYEDIILKKEDEHDRNEITFKINGELYDVVKDLWSIDTVLVDNSQFSLQTRKSLKDGQGTGGGVSYNSKTNGQGTGGGVQCRSQTDGQGTGGGVQYSSQTDGQRTGGGLPNSSQTDGLRTGGGLPNSSHTDGQRTGSGLPNSSQTGEQGTGSGVQYSSQTGEQGTGSGVQYSSQTGEQGTGSGTSRSSETQRSLINMSVAGKRDIDFGLTCVYGCTFMPDGHLVLCCGAEGLFLLNKDFTMNSWLDDDARRVAVIHRNEIIIAIDGLQQIKKVKLFPSMEVATTINMDRDCYGVDVSGGEIYVTCYDHSGNGEVQVLKLNGILQRRLGVNNGEYMFEFPDYVTVNKDGSKVFVSDKLTNSVTCLDKQGHVIYRYSDTELESPAGMYVDLEGNLLVCESNNVHVIGQDGRKEKILLSKKDGVRGPCCTAFRQSDGCLVVGMHDVTETNQSLTSFILK